MKKKYYNLRSLLGNTWAYFYIVVGARGVGKTFSAQDFVLGKWKKEKIPFTWIRLSKISRDKMLANDAEKCFDPKLVKKYGLELTTNGMDVFDHGEPMCKVLALSEMAKEKGVALFDGDDNRPLHIVTDEFQREPQERVTFDLTYNLVGTLENLCRNRTEKVRIVMLCNQLEQANDILMAFNFIPEKHGRYYLKSKRAVVDYVPNSPEYEEERAKTVAGILGGEQSNFTNEFRVDRSLLHKNRLKHPKYIIKFSKNVKEWFVVWDTGIIARWNKEKLGHSVPMRPYLDDRYDKKAAETIIRTYNIRGFKFKDLTTQLYFEKLLALLKPKG
jgi:hypothetical protein